jgi:hypothetical protein
MKFRTMTATFALALTPVAGFVALTLALSTSTAAAPLASAAASRVRWEISTVTCSGPGGSYPCTLNPGGSATAMAVDCLSVIPGLTVGCSTITMTGSGTFVAPAKAGSSSDASEESRADTVTGGGTWTVVSPAGTTSGTFVVTQLVQWEKSTPLAVPDCGTCETTDNIDNLSEATGGLAVLRVAYSDGTTGVLTLACAGLADPFAVTEGITASKGVVLPEVAIPGINVPPLPPTFQIRRVLVPVLFWYPGVFTYFVEFHVN